MRREKFCKNTHFLKTFDLGELNARNMRTQRKHRFWISFVFVLPIFWRLGCKSVAISVLILDFLPLGRVFSYIPVSDIFQLLKTSASTFWSNSWPFLPFRNEFFFYSLSLHSLTFISACVCEYIYIYLSICVHIFDDQSLCLQQH